MEQQASLNEQFLSKVNRIIEENIPNEHFTVEDLAESVGLSRSMLHRKLKALTGKSASDLITEIRLKKAKEWLEGGVATVSEIAYRVGFNDPSYFTKVFKKHFNISPVHVIKNVGGISDQEPVPESIAPAKHIMSRKVLNVITIIVIIGIIGTGIYLLSSKKQTEKSIAVLPLNNLTGHDENSYLVDGMHDALIGELGQIESLRVISRTSTLQFRNSEMMLKDIAEELDVNTIVEGSVQCFGDSLCLLIQMIDVFPKEQHLLASEYHDDMKNVLAVQSRVVKDIASNVKIKLTKEQERQITKSRQVDPETYKSYLRGMYHMNQGTLEGYETGMEYLQNAISHDPGDPFAYAGLALGNAIMGHGIIFNPEVFQTAEAAATKALKIDPTIDEAYLALAMLNLYNFWNWPAAQEAFEEALRRNPNNEIAHAHYAWYHVLFGDKERSLYHARQATILEPLAASYYSWLGWLQVYFEEYEEAEISALKALELVDNHPYGNIVLGWTYLFRDQPDKAIAIHEKLPMVHPFYKMVLANTYVLTGNKDKAVILRNEVEEEAKEHWVNPFERGLLAAMLGDKELAFKFINEAVEHKYYPTNHINVCVPHVSYLREDTRYLAIFQKMQLSVDPKKAMLAEHN